MVTELLNAKIHAQIQVLYQSLDSPTTTNTPTHTELLTSDCLWRMAEQAGKDAATEQSTSHQRECKGLSFLLSLYSITEICSLLLLQASGDQHSSLSSEIAITVTPGVFWSETCPLRQRGTPQALPELLRVLLG